MATIWFSAVIKSVSETIVIVVCLKMSVFAIDGILEFHFSSVSDNSSPVTSLVVVFTNILYVTFSIVSNEDSLFLLIVLTEFFVDLSCPDWTSNLFSCIC